MGKPCLNTREKITKRKVNKLHSQAPRYVLPPIIRRNVVRRHYQITDPSVRRRLFH